MRKAALVWFGMVVALLVAIGLVVLSSASEANAIRLYGDPYFFMKRQAGYLAAGVFIAVCVAMFDYRRWKDSKWLAWLFYAVVVVLLLFVFKCKEVNGSQRWIPIGPVHLQPSELAKLAIVIMLSVWLDSLGWKVELFMKGAFWPYVLIGFIALPIILEPDFGSTMVVGAVGCLITFVAGTRIMHMLPFILLGLTGGVLKLLMNANRMARLRDPKALYQVKMALAALGNGGIWGVGLGESMQKHAYLPEAHTDFVFAVGAEELGLLFSVGVLLLFVAFFALSVYVARKSHDRFGRFLVVGMAFIVFFQAVFNLGVVCQALPTKGMALPFFSYGGTNLMSAFFAVGTILSVGIHSYRDRKREAIRSVRFV